MGNDKVRFETHKLGREGGGSLVLPLRIPALDDKVLAFDIPALTQPLQECLPVTGPFGGCRCGWTTHEETYPIDLRRLLPIGG
jgi:hypothetical protein